MLEIKSEKEGEYYCLLPQYKRKQSDESKRDKN